MSAHRIRYEGPTSLAVRAATVLADADGIALTSAGQAEQPDGAADKVFLNLTVEATPYAVAAAVKSLRDLLPADARVTVEDA